MSFFLTPGKAGLLGAALVLAFFAIFIVLGFYQPGYNHLTNTISALVLGELGWIQTLNFYVLTLAFLCIGFGLGKNLTGHNFNLILAIFSSFAICTIFIALVPTQKMNAQETVQLQNLSASGKIHYGFLFCLMLIVPMLLFPVIKAMSRHSEWRPLVAYTITTLVCNFIVGILWYYFLALGYFSEWKGLVQKLLAVNVLGWFVILGLRLWRLERQPKNKSIMT